MTSPCSNRRTGRCAPPSLISVRADLNREPARSKVTMRALVTGVAAHDLYHAGQIQLLKRLASR